MTTTTHLDTDALDYVAKGGRMNTEQALPSDEIQFLASLPPSAGAIAIDGGDREGGRLKLDVPGTELASLLRLTMLRGRTLLVTIAPQQAVLPFGPVAPDNEAAAAFPQNPLFQDPLETQAAKVAEVGTGTGDGDVTVSAPPIDGGLPAHVHRFKDDVCQDCGATRGDEESGAGEIEYADGTIVRVTDVVANAMAGLPPKVAKAAKARKVRRGLIPRGRVKAKR